MLEDVSTYVAQPGARAWDDATMLAAARERAAYIAQAGRRVSGSLNLSQTIRQSLRVSVPQLADWAQIMVLNGTSARYVSLRDGASTPLTVDRPVPPPGAFTGQGRILATGRPELLHVMADGATPDGLDALVPDPQMRRQVAELRPVDVLGIPLNARGTTFGSLTVARRAGFGFAPEDIALAEELAGRIALAIDAARRYAERAEVASILQAGLRPPALPEIPGVMLAARYRAATDQTDIGGDFFDVWGGADDWSLVLGDVSGKGVRAAVVTGQARHTVRGAAHVDRRPGPVLRALNALLVDDESGRFVTAFYARIRPDRTAGGLTVIGASAGHPAPLVIRADGDVTALPVRGIAAGLVPDADYAEATVHLAPGDTLLSYTDGVTEAGEHSVRRGTERLTDIARQYVAASVEALVEAIEMDVLERVDGAHRDDMAVLAVRAAR